MAARWHVRMELVRAVGVWPGVSDDLAEAADTKVQGMTGPSVAITIGTAYLRKVTPFLRVSSRLEDQFLDTPREVWGTAITNLPQRLVVTLTIWESADDDAHYMKSGAHGSAVKTHFDHVKDPTGNTFVSSGGFFGFRPLSTSGSVGGKNALPAKLLKGRLGT